MPAPNYFDEFERMRTPSRPYDPATNYSTIVSQLKDACKRNPSYLAIAPQNLLSPAELLPVIVLRDDGILREFIDPQILRSEGTREQCEACANIVLVRERVTIHPVVLTARPTRLTISYRLSDGQKKTQNFYDTQPADSTRQSIVGAVCHEIDHVAGKLIVDFAHQRLVAARKMLSEAEEKESPESATLIRQYAYMRMPLVLLREGDEYRLLHGSDLGKDIPPVSPDALFVDGFYRSPKDIEQTFVPRDGELLPIRSSRPLLAR